MHRKLSLPAAALFVAFAGSAAPAHAGATGVEAEILKLEDAINAAYAANDLPKYFSYYAPELRAMYPEGPTTLADYRDYWTKFIQDGGKIASFVPVGMQVQVSPAGDSAVATYQAKVSTVSPGKPPADESFNETDIWFKRDGAWKIVAMQYGTATIAN